MPARLATRSATRTGSVAPKALVAIVLMAVAVVTLLGFGDAAHAATVRPAAPSHRTCIPTPNPTADGLEVVGVVAPSGSSELGAALGVSQSHQLRSATPAPVGPRGYYATISAFWTRAVNADPASC